MSENLEGIEQKIQQDNIVKNIEEQMRRIQEFKTSEESYVESLKRLQKIRTCIQTTLESSTGLGAVFFISAPTEDQKTALDFLENNLKQIDEIFNVHRNLEPSETNTINIGKFFTEIISSFPQNPTSEEMNTIINKIAKELPLIILFSNNVAGKYIEKTGNIRNAFETACTFYHFSSELSKKLFNEEREQQQVIQIANGDLAAPFQRYMRYDLLLESLLKPVSKNILLRYPLCQKLADYTKLETAIRDKNYDELVRDILNLAKTLSIENSKVLADVQEIQKLEKEIRYRRYDCILESLIKELENKILSENQVYVSLYTARQQIKKTIAAGKRGFTSIPLLGQEKDWVEELRIKLRTKATNMHEVSDNQKARTIAYRQEDTILILDQIDCSEKSIGKLITCLNEAIKLHGSFDTPVVETAEFKLEPGAISKVWITIPNMGPNSSDYTYCIQQTAVGFSITLNDEENIDTLADTTLFYKYALADGIAEWMDIFKSEPRNYLYALKKVIMNEGVIGNQEVREPSGTVPVEQKFKFKLGESEDMPAKKNTSTATTSNQAIANRTKTAVSPEDMQVELKVKLDKQAEDLIHLNAKLIETQEESKKKLEAVENELAALKQSKADAVKGHVEEIKTLKAANELTVQNLKLSIESLSLAKVNQKNIQLEQVIELQKSVIEQSNQNIQTLEVQKVELAKTAYDLCMKLQASNESNQSLKEQSKNAHNIFTTTMFNLTNQADKNATRATENEERAKLAEEENKTLRGALEESQRQRDLEHSENERLRLELSTLQAQLEQATSNAAEVKVNAENAENARHEAMRAQQAAEAETARLTQAERDAELVRQHQANLQATQQALETERVRIAEMQRFMQGM